jgi:predicted amidophosphoribosyltransferase
MKNHLCSNCKKTNSFDDVLCKHFGISLKESEEIPKICSTCKKTFKKNIRFCPHCGIFG